MAEEKEERKRKRQNSGQFEPSNKRSRESDEDDESENRENRKPSSDLLMDERCMYDDPILEDSQYYLENEENSKLDNDDSLLGEQTPHDRSKSPKKKIKILIYQDNEVTPFQIREIPLPAMSWVDQSELSLLMCFKEDVLDRDRDPKLFQKHSTLTPRMRSILFDWLMEVCDVYKLRRVTYYLAIDYVDRYLSRIEELPKHQLQLLGITCLFIASKVEEVYPPKLSELAYVTDGACTDGDMLIKEMAVLQTLNWDINPFTVSGWLNLYMQILYNTKNFRDSEYDRSIINDDFIFPQFSAFSFVRASQLVDLCSLDDGMLHFQYSIIAASAMYYIFNREQALFVSGFTWEQIKGCVTRMAPFYQVVSKMPLFSAYEGPKDRCRGSTGLKKCNPNILVNEAHSVQTHMISLKMLEEVYKTTNEISDTESTEENASEQKLAAASLESESKESGEEESLVDVDISIGCNHKRNNCDDYSKKFNSKNLVQVDNSSQHRN